MTTPRPDFDPRPQALAQGVPQPQAAYPSSTSLTAAAPSAKRPWWQRLLGVAFMAALVLGLIWACQPRAHGDDAGATQACRDAVRSQLKDPGSAEFSGEFAVSHGQDAWSVNGTVRARNSFGGMVAGKYRCTASYTRGGGYFAVATLSE